MGNIDQLDTDRLRSWIGRRESVTDELNPWPARAVAAMLDREDFEGAPGDGLPPLWQWFYFLATVPQARLGGDGHPERGGFMPPIPLPRRMFAGSRMQFHRPLRLGEPAVREAEIGDVTFKTGRSGRLAFVTVSYRYLQAGGTCIEEEQDIVYREPGAPLPPPKPVTPGAPEPGTWLREFRPDSRLLFRFSALTFNAHRIHYDRPYAREEEGYPGLVVHGPLTAVLLADLVRRHDPRPVTGFSFRGMAPLFDLHPFRLLGRAKGTEIALEARGPDDRPALRATARVSAEA